MFKKVNASNFTLSKDAADKIYNEVRAALGSYNTENISVYDDVYLQTIKDVISLRVGLLAISEIKDDLLKTSFLTVSFNSDIGFDITVGYVNGELVYGVLIK